MPSTPPSVTAENACTLYKPNARMALPRRASAQERKEMRKGTDPFKKSVKMNADSMIMESKDRVKHGNKRKVEHMWSGLKAFLMKNKIQWGILI